MGKHIAGFVHYYSVRKVNKNRWGHFCELFQCIHGSSVPMPPGSFLPHPQITAPHNEKHTSTSYSPPRNSMPENQWSDTLYKWAFAIPKCTSQCSSCSCKEKITSNTGYRDLQILNCLCATQVFNQSFRQLFTALWELHQLFAHFILAMLWRASLGRNGFSWCSSESVASQLCLPQIHIRVYSLLLTTLVLH